ncbi:hypothetical protein BC830DRAFT_1159347, partial [Chytriomyces sp. MP71]
MQRTSQFNEEPPVVPKLKKNPHLAITKPATGAASGTATRIATTDSIRNKVATRKSSPASIAPSIKSKPKTVQASSPPTSRLSVIPERTSSSGTTRVHTTQTRKNNFLPTLLPSPPPPTKPQEGDPCKDILSVVTSYLLTSNNVANAWDLHTKIRSYVGLDMADHRILRIPGFDDNDSGLVPEAFSFELGVYVDVIYAFLAKEGTARSKCQEYFNEH